MLGPQLRIKIMALNEQARHSTQRCDARQHHKHSLEPLRISLHNRDPERRVLRHLLQDSQVNLRVPCNIRREASTHQVGREYILEHGPADDDAYAHAESAHEQVHRSCGRGVCGIGGRLGGKIESVEQESVADADEDEDAGPGGGRGADVEDDHEAVAQDCEDPATPDGPAEATNTGDNDTDN